MKEAIVRNSDCSKMHFESVLFFVLRFIESHYLQTKIKMQFDKRKKGLKSFKKSITPITEKPNFHFSIFCCFKSRNSFHNLFIKLGFSSIIISCHRPTYVFAFTFDRIIIIITI